MNTKLTGKCGDSLPADQLLLRVKRYLISDYGLTCMRFPSCSDIVLTPVFWPL